MDDFGLPIPKQSQVMDQRGGKTHEKRKLSHSTYNADRHPPAYTPNHETPPEIIALGTCCALLGSNFRIPDGASGSFLRSCQQFAFKSWVLTERRPAETILHLERLSCPLLWCREAFDDHKKLVDHVMSCPYIYDGEYWCPYCQRSERFVEASVPEIGIHSDKNPRKRFLKGAVNVLRKLSGKSKKARSHNMPDGDRDHKYDAAVEIEIDGTAKDFPELQAQSPGAVLSSGFESTVKQYTEMEGAAFPAELACGDHMDGNNQTDQGNRMCGHNAMCPALVRDSSHSTETSTPESIQTPISPISPVDRSQIRLFDPLDSPVSPTDDTDSWPFDAAPLSNSSSILHKQESTWPFSAPKLPEIQFDPELTNIDAFIWYSSTVNPATASTNAVGTVTNTTSSHDLGTYGYADNTPFDSGEVTHQGENTDYSKPLSDEYWQNSAMRKHITGPLIIRMGLEGFHPMVLDFDGQLSGSWLVSVRELQLQLVKGALACAKSEHLCDDFVEAVMDLGNKTFALLGLGLTTYDQECVDEIGRILHEYRSSRAESDDESQELDFTSHGSSEVPMLFELPGSAGSSRTSDAPWEMPPSFNFSGDTNSRPVSPLDDSFFRPVDRNETISPYIPELPELDTAGPSTPPVPEHPHGENTAFSPRMSQTAVPEATMQCDECQTVLKGKAIWLRSNMQRHKREKHSKVPIPKPACSEPGCPRTFSRKHNLMVHLKSVHNRA